MIASRASEARELTPSSSPVRPPYSLRRAWRERRDLRVCAGFLSDSRLGLSLRERASIVRRLYAASFSIDSPHTQEEMLTYMRSILAVPRSEQGVVVEAGCYKGSSTAKFSLAAHAAGRELVVFDSFAGLPEHDEPHDRNIFGRPEHLRAGAYCGTLDEVRRNVARYGSIESCRFVPGWFKDSLPGFHERIVAIYLDVDLVASTRTCLVHLYPRLCAGGVLYSQDGHLPLVIALLDDEDFWRREVGCAKPVIEGLGGRKLIRIVKE
jgi:O-methyltransferase